MTAILSFRWSTSSLAKAADLCLIAPATANVIAKMAHGLADDMLTTTVLACQCKKLVSPAMNTRMYENPITQDNLDILRKYGFTIIEPSSGYLACGGHGRREIPGPGSHSGICLPGTGLRKGYGRPSCAGHGRPHAGIHRPRALYYQSFHRENGICTRAERRPARCDRYVGHRSNLSETAPPLWMWSL